MDYFCFDIKNQFLHAVHPIAFIRKLKLVVDRKEFSEKEYYFVLRNQWIRADRIKTFVDIYWYLCETAAIYVRKDGGISQGEHQIVLTISISQLDQTAILDTLGKWPLRSQTITSTMYLGGE